MAKEKKGTGEKSKTTNSGSKKSGNQKSGTHNKREGK